MKTFYKALRDFYIAEIEEGYMERRINSEKELIGYMNGVSQDLIKHINEQINEKIESGKKIILENYKANCNKTYKYKVGDILDAPKQWDFEDMGLVADDNDQICLKGDNPFETGSVILEWDSIDETFVIDRVPAILGDQLYTLRCVSSSAVEYEYLTEEVIDKYFNKTEEKEK